MKKSGIVLSVQSSPPESNIVQEVGFDGRRVDSSNISKQTNKLLFGDFPIKI